MEQMTFGSGDFSVEIWTLGACVNDIRMPDRSGQVSSVLLGYGREEDRRHGRVYLGEICGPFANRIGAGGYAIDGRTHTPDLNDGGVATLHGGRRGWNYQEWTVTQLDQQGVRLHLDWSDPSGGFPGPIHADVEYRLDGWSLTHTIRASVDAPSVLNVVSHPYFNLSGGAEIADHELQVMANHYLPVDQASIPLPDAPWPVAGSPFDFRQPRRLGEALASQDPQMLLHGGIDHALVLDHPDHTVECVACLSHPASGRQLRIHTDYPALQVYTGQFLADPAVSHPAGAGPAGSGIALETEDYPNAPQRPDFPSTVVRPGQTYLRTTTWEFRVG